MECLRFLFRESIKPVNDKFDLLLKNKTDSAEMKFLRLPNKDSASRFVVLANSFHPGYNKNPRFYNPSGNFMLNPTGEYFIEQYIKVVDHYDEKGNALLDNFVSDNSLLSLLVEAGFYNSDGKRKEYLRGFVSVNDWTAFVKKLHSLDSDGTENITIDHVLINIAGKFQELIDTNLYEFFSDISIGLRVNYAIGPEDQSPGAVEYRQAIDQTMDKIAETGKIPRGGVVSYRNIEFTETSYEYIYTVPLASSEMSMQQAIGNGATVFHTAWSPFSVKNHSDLLKKLAKSNEFSALMKYVFPINRFAALSTLYSMMATKATLPSKDMFTTTKYLIKRSYDLHSAGNDAAYEDPWLKLSGGNAANQGFDEFNPFREMILKLIIETPMLILKGVTEVADPNIQIVKKIYEGMNMAVNLANELSLETLEDNYKEATKDLKPSEKPTFEEWAAENDIKIPDTNISISPAIAPVLSIMMLPSMMPYGVGFPPPFMFGPGIGPPMTPLAIPYLAGGLISDDLVQSRFASLRPPKKRKIDCPSPFPNPTVLLPPPEKDYDEGPDSETINDD